MVIKRIHMEVMVACLAAIAGMVVAGGSLELGVGWGSSGPDAGYFPFYVGLLPGHCRLCQCDLDPRHPSR